MRKDPESTNQAEKVEIMSTPVANRLIKDVLRNVQLEHALPSSLFAMAVAQVPIAISITDKKANILYINEAFTQVTGYQANEILGENESKLSDKSTPRHVYYDLWFTISRKRVWQGQLVNRRKQGQRYLADLTIAPMLDDHGNISHYIGMHRDVTQTHQTEQQLANQKCLIESVINASPEAMVVLDSQDRIVLDNDRYKMLISELNLAEPAQFFLDALRLELGQLWSNETLRRTGFQNREIRFESRRQHEIRWFVCSGNWFNEGNVHADHFFIKQSEQYLLLIINDISIQRQQQERLQLQALQKLLSDEEHLRSIRETILGTMHQIRLPLNQINAAMQIMKQRNDPQHQALRDLLTQVQTMGEETLTTLQHCVPKIPESSVIPINLNQLLHEVIRLCSQNLLANGVVVDWLPNPVLAKILGSETKLLMAFKQLIDNAIDALNRSGNDERIIKIGTSVEKNWVKVAFNDNGPGIPLHLHSKVFEPFYTTQAMGGIQVGMGLVMVKEIVNQHGGIIAIDPHCREGCCFKISFPVCTKNMTEVNGHE